MASTASGSFIYHDKVNVKSSLEDFLKIEYTDGLQNEFNTMEALINKLKKDTLTGKFRTKSFALGVTDNIRMLGNGNDRYVLATTDYSNGAETVEAQFNTTKLMGIFSITDETILKGSTDGSIFDVLNDSLGRMNMSLKHTINRFTYGSKSGKIGAITEVVAGSYKAAEAADNVMGTAYIDLKVANSLSLLPGMGISICTVAGTPEVATIVVQGKIWQKYNAGVGVEVIRVLLQDFATGADYEDITTSCYVYSRQLDKNSAPVPEYTGLQDIVIAQDNTIFGVNRAIYKTLNCTVQDLNNALLTESTLRDMADHIEISCSDDSKVKLVASNHKIISTIEKQMYQFKEYSLDANGNGFQLGRPTIKFDTYELYKDKYSRDKNVYLLDTDKIGELVRKEFGWITSGPTAQVLERRDGSEIYEGIMTKYADMYIDAWKSHAAFINVAETVA